MARQALNKVNNAVEYIEIILLQDAIINYYR